jgi:hypothetical protein
MRRTIFWSYERGTWQYDVLVFAIIVFVLAARPVWFGDRAQVAAPPHAGEAVVLQQEDASGIRTYRVDFHLLVPAPRSSELERRAHDALQKNVEDLRGRTFQVMRIEPVTDSAGNVHSYDVTVKP